MYKLIRNVHLALGLGCSAFLLMYSASAVQMSHPSWFSDEETIVKSESPVSAEQAESPRLFARALMQDGMWGELQNIQQDESGFQFRIVRPGTVHQVRYTAGAPRAAIETHVSNLMGMLNRLHHTAGFYREQSLTHWWAAFVALISLALLILGATGVYMWFRLYKERVVGGVLLASGLIIGVGLLAATRLQP